jgi:transposase
MPKPYSLDLRERVVRDVDEGHSRRAAAAHFRVSVSFVVNLVKAFRVRGSLAPKPSGGRRHAKLEPHRAFLLEKVAEKADITMPELAAELAAATCEKADPASLSRWLIRIGYRFKKRMARPVCKGFDRERRMISLLQRIRLRGLPPSQDGDTRVPVLIKLPASSAVF